MGCRVDAGLYFFGVSPTNVSWPGGIIPYEFDTNYHAITPAEETVYLDVLREWELACNIHLLPRTNQANYLRLQYDPNFGGGYFCLCNPSTITVSGLGRGYAHEMGHALGLDHEHIRPDRDNYITINWTNIVPSGSNLFVVVTNELTNGPYDFESIMHYSRGNFSINPGVADVLVPKPAYYDKYYYRISSPCLSVGDRAAAANLYGPPATPLTNVVTNTRDAGFGTLRAAIYFANDHPGSTIRFNISTNDPGYANGAWTIKPSGDLPPLVGDGTIIDGGTQPGFLDHPIIVVDGSGLIPEVTGASSGSGEAFGGNSSGLFIYQAACAIKSLVFINFQDNGIALQTPSATNNVLQGCYIGVDATGTNAGPNVTDGVGITRGAKNNFIGGTNASQRNVISGNVRQGILIGDTNTSGNVVLGNYIGTDASGMRAVTNSGYGIYVGNGASAVTIGSTKGGRNVISGNLGDGMAFNGTSNIFILGNYIGTSASGAAALANGLAGIEVFNGSRNLTVGGTSPAARNVISGNVLDGIILNNTSNGVVQGNYIGTDATGMTAITNGGPGIEMFNQVYGLTIGGTNSAARNLISGDNNSGLIVNGSSGITIQGNYIGTDATGNHALTNNGPGIQCFNAHDLSIIGNVVSGNLGEGIILNDTHQSVVQGNLIGLDAGGNRSIPNTYSGINIFNGSSGLTIGGATAGVQNVISGNGFHGVQISGGASSNLIQGNFVGTDTTGTVGLGNGVIGIYFYGAASNNTVGLTTDGSGAGNRIAFNGFTGVEVDDTNSVGNTIRGNGIFNNGGLGIDLAGPGLFGVTPNDPGDADLGPNNLQNFPVVTNAYGYAGTTAIAGTLNSVADGVFYIDVYRNPVADPSGYGQGQSYVGSVNVTTDNSGNANFVLTNTSGNYAGQSLTATATSADGDTSEFGPDLIPTNRPAPSAQFSGPFVARTNGFSFSLTLQTNFTYRIQATTNLGLHSTPWIDLTNFTPTLSSLTFTDRTATNYGSRYYRVVSP